MSTTENNFFFLDKLVYFAVLTKTCVFAFRICSLFRLAGERQRDPQTPKPFLGSWPASREPLCHIVLSRHRNNHGRLIAALKISHNPAVKFAFLFVFNSSEKQRYNGCAVLAACVRKKQSGDFVAGVCGELVTEIFGRGASVLGCWLKGAESGVQRNSKAFLCG